MTQPSLSEEAGVVATRVHYRIRFPAQAGKYGEFYSSNNGTSQWSDLAKVKALVTRGQPKGYKGRLLVPFEDFEVVEVTERVETTTRIVALSKSSPISREDA